MLLERVGGVVVCPAIKLADGHEHQAPAVDHAKLTEHVALEVVHRDAERLGRLLARQGHSPRAGRALGDAFGDKASQRGKHLLGTRHALRWRASQPRTLVLIRRNTPLSSQCLSSLVCNTLLPLALRTPQEPTARRRSRGECQVVRPGAVVRVVIMTQERRAAAIGSRPVQSAMCIRGAMAWTSWSESSRAAIGAPRQSSRRWRQFLACGVRLSGIARCGAVNVLCWPDVWAGGLLTS